MNRRDLLRGLLALPLAPLAAKLLPREFPKGIPLRLDDHFECSEVNVDLASGSDQTSIWFVTWGAGPAFKAFPFERLHDGPIEEWSAKDVQRLVTSQWERNWLKESIHG